MKIAFVDAKCPAPYDSETLLNRSLGGTEATVIRIAQALSQRHDVSILQHNRAEPCEESPSLRFLPIGSLDSATRDAQHVVFIQAARHRHLGQVARHSSARLWVWLHNYLKQEVRFSPRQHLFHRLGIICVSRTHAQHTARHLRSLPSYWASFGRLARGGVLYHYNPVDVDLAGAAPVVKDPHKLVFFSSPHKGIEQVVDAFRSVHAVDPRLKLYVANPGYIKDFDPALLDAPGIVKLGSLPQRVVLQHIREALCVFYPQRKRAETFGLVYAEANATGTPVLAHDFGAAREILADSNPPFDTSDAGRVVDTLMKWAGGGAPVVGPNPAFQLETVADQWDRFFQEPDAFIEAQARERSLPAPR
jgi:glycosyltransferase involved in cell wall biosynthesis